MPEFGQKIVDGELRSNPEAAQNKIIANRIVRTKAAEALGRSERGRCIRAFSRHKGEAPNDVSALPLADKKARAFTRFFYAGAAACAMDKQGRVGIPQGLRDFASLRKNVVIVGVTKRIEIWDKAKWQAYNEATAANLADAMADLGI